MFSSRSKYFRDLGYVYCYYFLEKTVVSFLVDMVKRGLKVLFFDKRFMLKDSFFFRIRFKSEIRIYYVGVYYRFE